MKQSNVKYARIWKVIGFILASILLFATLCIVMKPKNEMDYANKRSFEAYRIFDEPENSIDVVMLGHSGVYRGLSPMEMYREYGFTSYACSRSTQLPWESYDFLEQVLQKQTPKVVLFETDQLFYDKGNSVDSNHRRNQLDKVFPIFKNHASWKDWLPGKNYRERSATKGYQYINSVKPYTGDKQLVYTDQVYRIRKSHYKSLVKIYELCKQKNIQLFLLEVPSKMIWDYSKFNAVKAFAEQNKLDFIDTNQRLEEFDFDWKTDTYDAGDHLNFSGAEKLSAYVGKYLKERYDLPDRREDEKYKTWEEDLIRYEKITGDNNGKKN